MYAKPFIVAIAMMLAMFSVAGCTSTSQGTLTSGLGDNESIALALPDAVSVLPESAFASGANSADMAVLSTSEPSGQSVPDEPLMVASIQPQFEPASFVAPIQPAGPISEIDGLIAKYATVYDLPVAFVRRVVNRESTFNPRAYNKGHWGLMQIKHATARGMGYRGPAKGLLDAETNLKYAVKYLRGAWLVADGNADRADRLYQRGYYYAAKRKGLLEATGLGKDRQRRRGKVDPEA